MMMSKRFYLINFGLLLILSFLAVEYFAVQDHSKPSGKDWLVSEAKRTPPPRVAKLPETKEVATQTSYRVIPDKNIFNPDRKEFAIPVSSTPEVKKPPVRPAIALYGVALGEQLQNAIVRNTTRGAGEREMMTVTVGDKIGGYTVANISSDRITLETPGDSFEVWLFDPARSKNSPVVSAPAPVPQISQATPPVPARTLPAPPTLLTRPLARPPLVTPPQTTPPSLNRRAVRPQVATVPPPKTRPDPDEDDEDDTTNEPPTLFEYRP